MKQCKYCKTEIDSKAKVCPNCRKKQGGKLKFIVIALVAVVIIGAIASGGETDEVKKVNGDTTQSENSTNTSKPDSNESSTDFKIGETAEYKNIQVTLLNVTESKGSDIFKPDNGNIFVQCEFEITNNSDSDLAVSSVMCFNTYVDGYSTTQSISALADNSGNQLDGTVAPGKKMKGVIAYEESKDWKEIELQFTPSVWSDKKMVFKYSK